MFESPTKLNLRHLQNIIDFASELAHLLNAGVALVPALHILQHSRQNQRTAFIRVLTAVKYHLQAGDSFTQACAKHPRFFTPQCLHMIQIGEQTGQLAHQLTALATVYTRKLMTHSQIREALTYPMMVLISGIMALTVILAVVIPRMQSLYAQFNAHLPWFTLLVVHLASQFKTLACWLMISLIFSTLLFIKHYQRRHFQLRRWIESVMIQLPIAGAIWRHTAISELTQHLAMSLRAGMPIDRALQLCKNLNHRALCQQTIQSLLTQICMGKPLAKSIQSCSLFPKRAIHMIAIGEQGGCLIEMLSEIARYHDNQLKHALKVFSKWLEPAIMIFIALIVGTVVIAMYLPLIQLGNLM